MPHEYLTKLIHKPQLLSPLHKYRWKLTATLRKWHQYETLPETTSKNHTRCSPRARPPARTRSSRCGGAEIEKSRTATAETGLKRTGGSQGKRSRDPRWQSRRRGSRRCDAVALDDAMRLKPLPADPEHSKLAKRALSQRRLPYALGIVSYPYRIIPYSNRMSYWKPTRRQRS